MRDWFARLVSHRMQALVRKELNQIRRDRRILMSLVLPPIVQLMLFGSVLNPKVANLHLGVVDDSQSPESRDLIAALGQSGSFELRGVYGSVDALGTEISRGTLDTGVVIPYDFARRLERGQSTTIQVLLNAVNANTAAISQGYVQGVLQSYNATRSPATAHATVQSVVQGRPGRSGQVQLSPAFLYNPGLVTSWFIVTGLFGMLLVMNGSITASTTMVKEREAGTLEQLLMTPATTTEIIVAKILPPFVLLCVMTLVALGVVRFFFHVPFHGSALAVFTAAALCLLTGIGIGTAVATFTKTAQQAQLATFFITPPLSSLSGALTPVQAMPRWMQPWTVLNPVYHFAVIARATLIKGTSAMSLWPNLLALALFAIVLVSMSVWRFRRQLS
jgi:ABC-2 type transport system permease protein